MALDEGVEVFATAGRDIQDDSATVEINADWVPVWKQASGVRRAACGSAARQSIHRNARQRQEMRLLFLQRWRARRGQGWPARRPVASSDLNPRDTGVGLMP